ncbi:MAG: YbaK/EbsC family protein [Oligoflexales bacterium]|nr:YbaK/EbsC family protein [Oligoflexales bacterium]
MSLSPSALKIQESLDKHGFAFKVIELDDSARTADQAAQALGCGVSQIVKSLIFVTKESKTPILVLVSGSNRVNEHRLETILQRKISKGDASFVREVTGFAIGGIPPLGHKQQLETYIDEDLFQYEALWAAAGTPHAVFKLKPDDLKILTLGQVVSIK